MQRQCSISACILPKRALHSLLFSWITTAHLLQLLFAILLFSNIHTLKPCVDFQKKLCLKRFVYFVHHHYLFRIPTNQMTRRINSINSTSTTFQMENIVGNQYFWNNYRKILFWKFHVTGINEPHAAHAFAFHLMPLLLSCCFLPAEVRCIDLKKMERAGGWLLPPLLLLLSDPLNRAVCLPVSTLGSYS